MGRQEMEIYIYVGLGVSLFLVLFCVLFFPIRKNHARKRVTRYSKVIKKIQELNDKTSEVDISYPHHIDDVVVCKTEQQLSEYNPRKEFEKHMSELEEIYYRQQDNLAIYHEYKKAYDRIRKDVVTDDDSIKASRMKKRRFLKVEAKILDSLFLPDYDREEVYFRVCSKFVYTDDGTERESESQYVFAKDLFVEDDSDEVMTDEQIKTETQETSSEPIEEEVEEKETEETEFEENGILYHIDDGETVSILKVTDRERIGSLELGTVNHAGKKYVLRKIPSDIFINDKNIISLYLGEGVEEIEDNAFRNCFRLEKVEFPSSLRNIGKKAFNGDTAIEYVTLPDGLEELGDEAFALCTNLSMFSISGKTKHVGRSILWLDENAEIHIRDQYPSLWDEHFNVENSEVIYDFEE